jgi:hypothetical protein
MLLIHRSPDEPEFVSSKRRRIVRKWFIYACRFIQAKRKIVELAEKKQRQMAQEKEMKRREDRYVRHAEKAATPNGSFAFDDSGLSADPALDLSKTVQKSFSFLIFKPRRIPGTASQSLSAAVAEYNKNLPTSPIGRDLQPSPRPAPRKAYFKPPWDSVEVDIRAEGVVFILEDERWALKGLLERVSLRVEVEEGRQKRTVVVEKPQKGVTWTAEYHPEAFKAEGEAYPTVKMYDVNCALAQVNLAYSHNALVQLIELFSAYKADNSAAFAEEQTLQIDKQRLTPLPVSQKQLRNKPKSALFSFFSQSLSQKLLSIKSHLHTLASDADAFLSPINLSLKLDFGGVDLALMEENSASSVGDLYLPPGKWEVEKTEERLKAGLWGFGVTVNSSIMRVIEFVEVRARQTVAGLMVRRGKRTD